MKRILALLALGTLAFAAGPTELTVLAVSHSVTEHDFTVTQSRTTRTNCNLYPNTVNCTSTTSGGGTQQRAIYFLREIVTSTEGGIVTQYTLSRTARWVWSSLDWLEDGDHFHAEIKGKHMFITCHRGGNQGKKTVIKYDILDIRPI